MPGAPSKLPAVLALLAATAIWGLTVPTIKLALQTVPPFSLLFLRLSLASLLVLPFFLKNGSRPRLKLRDLPTLALLGLLGQTIPLGLGFWGLKYTSSLDASLITAITPIVVTIAGVLFLREIVTPRERLGTAIALGGTLVVILGPLFNGSDFAADQTRLLGNLLMVGYVASWSTFIIWSKKILNRRRHYSPLTITAAGFLTSVLVYLPLSLGEQLLTKPKVIPPAGRILFHFGATPLTAPTLAMIGFLALFSSVVAYFLYQWGLEQMEASETSLFSYLQPIFTVPAAYWLLGETATVGFLIGGLIIAVGIGLAERGGNQTS